MLEARVWLGVGPGEPPAPPSARNDTMSWDMPLTKSCLETLPVPFGSSFAKVALGPCCWNTAGGSIVWKAWANCCCVMLLEPPAMLSNSEDIFCWGGMPALAPAMACNAPASLMPETPILITPLTIFFGATGAVHDGPDAVA